MRSHNSFFVDEDNVNLVEVDYVVNNDIDGDRYRPYVTFVSI